MPRATWVTELDHSPQAVHDWHARPGAVHRLVPPFDPVTVLQEPTGLETGTTTVFRVKVGPLPRRFVAEHVDHAEPGGWTDVQRKGPFGFWRHEHRFEPLDGGARTRMVDDVEWRMPFGVLGRLFAQGAGHRLTQRMFGHRHRRTRDDLDRHAALADHGRKRIIIAGASGLLGRQLVAYLQGAGHEVVRLVRREPGGDEEARWDPTSGELDPAVLADADTVIHLGGAGIGDKRWSAKRRALIRSSRLETTGLLARTLAGMTDEARPRSFIVASAIGVYGERGDERLDESSAAGEGYLSEVAREWEAAADPARDAGVRVVHLRTGIVLSPRGGALGRMLLPFKLGAGGPIGNGRQWMSWIALEDWIGAVEFLVQREDLDGPVNLTAPEPVRQKQFARTLGRVLRRPTIIPLPGFAVRLLFGAMGQGLLLDGQQVHPDRLVAAGFEFIQPELETCLRAELGRDRLEPTPAPSN